MDILATGGQHPKHAGVLPVQGGKVAELGKGDEKPPSGPAGKGLSRGRKKVKGKMRGLLGKKQGKKNGKVGRRWKGAKGPPLSPSHTHAFCRGGQRGRCPWVCEQRERGKKELRGNHRGKTRNGERPGPRRPAGERPGPRRPAGERPGPKRPGPRRPGGRRPGGERPGPRRPGGERLGTKRPGSRRHGGRKPAGERPGTKRQGPRRPAGERPGTRGPAGRSPAGEKPVPRRPGSERPFPRRPFPRRPGGRRPGGRRPGPRRPGPRRPGPRRPGPRRPGPRRPGGGRPGPRRPGPRRPGGEKPGPRRPGSERPVPRRPGSERPVPRRPVPRRPVPRRPVPRRPGPRRPGGGRPGPRRPGGGRPGPRRPGPRRPGGERLGPRRPVGIKPGPRRPGVCEEREVVLGQYVPSPEGDPDPTGCSVPPAQQVACGSGRLSVRGCTARGCCPGPPRNRSCYYPMNACTKDGHFVFSVFRDSVAPAIDLRSLRAGGHCQPSLVAPDLVVFKFRLESCGAKVTELGEERHYVATVTGSVPMVVGRYGKIARVSPYRLRVQCAYTPGSTASVGYFVRELGPPLDTVAMGTIRVQIRVAKNKCYSRYYDDAALPLRLSLKSPLYLEVRLVAPPDPSLVLLVHYCLAYPSSAQAAWVLLYDGCPNPHDPSPSRLVNPGRSGQQRRFSVQTFQFINPQSGKYWDQEIYVLCSTEVCSPKERECTEKCYSPTGPPERPTPVSAVTSEGQQTVLQGPFLLPAAPSTELQQTAGVAQPQLQTPPL
ncbi:collagen alpha-1(I) chain [Amia ocellicauda]|uniref:collagen alpha-1(I) chain n=1 Tax=Amia ocellicauda TaxID=2972642 RepID=UPI0034638660